MASEWFYARDGQKHGPYSSPQLRAMAQSGELLRTDLIWKEGMADWRPAGETTQLFAGVREGGKTQSKAKVAVAESGGAEATVPQPKGLKATAQAAARATQLAAERARLTTVSLPAAYLELGKHCYDTRAFASEFPKEMSELDQLEARLSAEAESTTPTSASSWGDRAKALAGKGLDFAQKQKAALEKAASLRRLGKLAYEQRGSAAGPASLVGPVASAVSRVAEIDSLVTASPSKRRRVRLWHVAAAVMCVSLVVGAVKELMSDKRTPGTTSVSDSAEPGPPPQAKAVATRAPETNKTASRPDGALERSVAPNSSSAATAAPVYARRKAPAIANADEVAAQAAASKLNPRAIRLFTTIEPPRAVTQIIISSDRKGFYHTDQLFPLCTTLLHLAVTSSGEESAFGMERLRNCRNLEVLDLGTLTLVPEDFRGIAEQFPALTALRCRVKNASDSEWKSGIRLAAICSELAKCKHLSAVSLSLTRGHNGQDYVKYLSQCGQLQYLDLEGATVTELATLVPKLRQLKVLELPRRSMYSPPPKGETVAWTGEAYDWIYNDKELAAFLKVAGNLSGVAKLFLEYSSKDPDLVEKLRKACPKTEVIASARGEMRSSGPKVSWRDYVPEIDEGQEPLAWSR